MRRLSRYVGILLDAITGSCDTYVADVKDPLPTYRYHPTLKEMPTGTYVESRRTIYRTHYHRWWIPDTYHVVYTVRGLAGEGLVVSPEYTQTLALPSLGNRLLMLTEYPHAYAVRAFLNRVDGGPLASVVEA